MELLACEFLSADLLINVNIKAKLEEVVDKM